MKPKGITKTREQWQAELNPLVFEISRNKRSEKALTGKYHNTNEPGTYVCVCCGHELFSSKMKFETNTGYASFKAPLNEDAIDLAEHRVSPMMTKTEVVCLNCQGHLGHVYDDGPLPRLQRFSINSAVIRLEEKK